MDGGFRRLSLGAGRDYKLANSAGSLHLTCTTAIPDAPNGDSTAWFDIVDPGPSATTYRLYVFAGEAVPPPINIIDVTVDELVDVANAVNGIRVIDAAGSHHLDVLTA
jgi:hypothetical protein